MKKPAILLIALMCTAGLMAQKSQYFTYDRPAVDAAIGSINETNSTAAAILFPADTTEKKTMGGFGAFVWGYVPGCLGSLGGALIGLALGGSSTADGIILGYAIGSAVGLIVPPILVMASSKKGGNCALAGLGGVLGIATTTGVGALAAYYFYLKILEDMENQMSNCSETMVVPLMMNIF